MIPTQIQYQPSPSLQIQPKPPHHHLPPKITEINRIPLLKTNKIKHTIIKPIQPNPIPPNPIPFKPKRDTRSINTATTTTDILCLMDALKLPVPIDMYSSFIKECTAARDGTIASELYAHIKRSRRRLSLPLRNRILLMYASCGCLKLAREMFDEMPNLDFNSWAIIISGCIDSGDYHEALYLFTDMIRRQYVMFVEFTVSSWILVYILKACVCTMNVGLGKQLHGLLIKMGSVNNAYLGSSLISFYGNFNLYEEANFVFYELPQHDTVTWTSKIVNNCKEERFDEVLNIYNEMGKAGIKKNEYTVSSVLRACGRLKDCERKCGQQVHGEAIKLGIASSSAFVKCGLVDMYGKCGLVRDARRVFEMIREEERNEACWNAMLRGYIEHGLGIEAVNFLCEMKNSGFEPHTSLINEVRITCGSG